MGPVCFSAYLTGCYRYSEALRHQLTPGEASFSDGKWTKRAERWSGSSVGAGEPEDLYMDWFSVRMDTKPPCWSDFSCVYTCFPIKTGSLFNTNIKAIIVLNFLDVFSRETAISCCLRWRWFLFFSMSEVYSNKWQETREAKRINS